MSKKLFYTDPLASAYMAREFGVEYRAKPSGLAVTCDVSLDDGMGKSINIKPNGDVYYIHPDSYHIFEPRVGDYVSFRKDKEVYLVDEYSSWDVPPDKIIQRNNKPFFMPEGE